MNYQYITNEFLLRLSRAFIFTLKQTHCQFDLKPAHHYDTYRITPNNQTNNMNYTMQ